MTNEPKEGKMKLMHRLAHWLGWNCGRPDAFYDGDRLMMSFLCNCGQRSKPFPIDKIVDRELKINQ